MSNKCVLVITDGIGHNPNTKFNAFANAKKPAFDYLFENAAVSYLKTSGEAVGLPEGQMGNSEVGHMTIGSGQILFQNLVKIDKAIQDNTLAKNQALLNLLNKTKRVHIIGLYSDGGVHSHLNHFNEIAKICQNNGKEIILHPITDGRDVAPNSAINFISNLSQKYKIASISGRFYAMDRDKRWDRIEKYHKTITQNANLVNLSPSEYIQNSYKNEIFDEFLEPVSFYDFGGIKSDDGIIFINFRNDRAREICEALGSMEFDEFQRSVVCENLITMTKYDDKFKFDIMFEPENISNTLSQVISSNNLRQLHTAETEKYAHVTFFFNGGKEEPVANEIRVLIPSPKVATYDQKPQMSAKEVGEVVLKGINDGIDFIVVNFANGDMVGHTGDYEAAIKAVEAVDEAIFKIVKLSQEKGYNYIQISDHGNCEEMRDINGEILTNHTTYDVFCFVLANGVEKISNGGLSNVAPTILKIMGLEIPKSMNKALF